MDLEKIELSSAYRLLGHGPVVLVATHDGQTPNACAVAWSAPVSRQPARFVLTIGTRHKTYQNLQKTKECVLCIPTVEALEQVMVCGRQTGHEGNKLEAAQIELLESKEVQAPRLACCVAWIEARLIQQPSLEASSLVLLEALLVETKPNVMTADRMFNVQQFKTLHHLGGDCFTTPGQVIEFQPRG